MGDPDRCWIWTPGIQEARRGYYSPRFRIKGTRISARRVMAWVSGLVSKSDDVRIWVTCNNQCCLNPAHLEIREWNPQEAVVICHPNMVPARSHGELQGVSL